MQAPDESVKVIKSLTPSELQWIEHSKSPEAQNVATTINALRYKPTDRRLLRILSTLILEARQQGLMKS